MAVFLEYFRMLRTKWGMPRSIMGYRSDEFEVPVIDTKAVAAEFVGTSILVIIGCGTACSNGWDNAQTRLLVAFAFGMTAMVLSYAMSHLSGAHFNVAVTFSLLVSEQIHFAQAVAYTLAQFFGGLIGAGILCVVFPCPMDATNNIAANIIDSTYADAGRAIVAEAFGTFLLCFAVRETSSTSKTRSGKNACIAVGFAVFVAHIMLLPIDNCSINPIRSTASAIISKLRSCESFVEGGLRDLWVMWVGPMVGALISGILAQPGWVRLAQKYRLI
jgi:MIP family channel proteins